MTGRLRLFLVAPIAFVLAPALTATPAAAETTVEVDDNDVKIKVAIDCVGCKGKRAADGTDLAKFWEKTAEKAWNAEFAKWSFCSKYKFELDVDIKALRADQFAREGRHRISLGEPPGWDGIDEPTPGAPPGAPETQRSPDGTRYFENDATGRMPENATPTVVNHEIGHVIGLGDDRDENGVALSNRQGTLMVGCAKQADGTVVSRTTKLKIDKQLIDRIGQQLVNLGKITCGQTWKGTLNGTGVNTGQPGVVCPDPSTHSGDFTMTVTPGGRATITGHMTNTSVCVGGFTTQADFTLEGKKTRSTITFAPVATFPFEVNLQVRGDRASGTSTASPGDFYTVTVNLMAQCQNCDEAVG